MRSGILRMINAIEVIEGICEMNRHSARGLLSFTAPLKQPLVRAINYTLSTSVLWALQRQSLSTAERECGNETHSFPPFL